MTTDAPQLLPGVSARRWQFALAIATVITCLAILVPASNAALDWAPDFTPAVFAPALLGMASTAVLAFAGRRRATREVAAGYTTLWRSYPTVAQLDDASGEVIRSAGDAYVSAREWRSRGISTTNVATAAVEKPTFWQRMLPATPQFAFVIVALVLSVLVGRLGKGGLQFVGFAIAGLVLLGVVASYSVVGLVGNARLKRLRAVEPLNFVFTIGGTPGVWSAISKISGDEGGIPPKPFGASADGDGLTFWGGTPPKLLCRLSWDRVTSVQADQIRVGNSARPGIIVVYRDDSGALQEAGLAGANADRVEFKSMPGARWIASVLNELRTGTSQARVL